MLTFKILLYKFVLSAVEKTEEVSVSTAPKKTKRERGNDDITVLYYVIRIFPTNKLLTKYM